MSQADAPQARRGRKTAAVNKKLQEYQSCGTQILFRLETTRDDCFL